MYTHAHTHTHTHLLPPISRSLSTAAYMHNVQHITPSNVQTHFKVEHESTQAISAPVWSHLHNSSGRAHAQLGSSWVQAASCIYICCLAQTWIRSFMSSLLEMHHLSVILQDHSSVFQMSDDIQWNASHAQTYTACIHPRTAKCKGNIPCSAWAQPEKVG